MRYAILLLLCFAPFASAQTLEQAATLKFLGSLYDAETGGYRNEPTAKPSLRATNAAVKATKYLGGKFDDAEKTAKFVLSCYDDKTGAFAEPGGKPEVTTSSIGVMAAMELGIAKEKLGHLPKYLTTKPMSFEEFRIAAAAIEAWGGPVYWPEPLKEFRGYLLGTFSGEKQSVKKGDNTTTLEAGMIVAGYRLEPEQLLKINMAERNAAARFTERGRLADGGWGKTAQVTSDLESTYRVMRAQAMMKLELNNPAKLREFIAKHRNDDGGYATKPGEKSSAAGTYYAVIITKWLDELEKK